MDFLNFQLLEIPVGGLWVASIRYSSHIFELLVEIQFIMLKNLSN